MKIEILYSQEQLAVVAEQLVKQVEGCRIITLTGDLGAGKTTLIKQLLYNWGVREEVVSPTFTYVNCYRTDSGQNLCHFDLYRIAKLEQFLELGFDEYLSEFGSTCLIEWPQVVESLLDEQAVGPIARLEIKHISNNQRKLIVMMGALE